MSDFDWNGLGSSIRDLVQDAVDTRDFEKLSSNINKTVQQALDEVGSGVREAGQAAGRAMDEAARNLRGQAGNRMDPGGRVGYTNFSRKASQSHYGGQGQAPGAVRQNNGRTFQGPALFVDTKGRQAGGTAMAVVGYVLGGFFAFLLAMFLVITIMDADLLALVFAFFTAILTGGFLFMGVQGSLRVQLAKRFRAYVRALGGRTFCELRELANDAGRDLKSVRKDLRQMMRRNWFLEGHLDRQENCLIVTNDTYQQYLHAEEQQRLCRLEEQRRVEEKGTIPEQVRETLEAGEAYIKRIRKCNDDIPGEEVSAKISRTEQLVRQIFERVEEHPETVSDIRKLMEYYLPTTVKLLDAYAELDAQPVQGEHIASSKREIEEALDTLNTAFEKLLDGLFRDTAWDVSADISVLQTMLAQEGLTNNDFRRDSR